MVAHNADEFRSRITRRIRKKNLVHGPGTQMGSDDDKSQRVKISRHCHFTVTPGVHGHSGAVQRHPVHPHHAGALRLRLSRG